VSEACAQGANGREAGLVTFLYLPPGDKRLSAFICGWESFQFLFFTDAWATHRTSPTGDWLEDAVFTLKRFPLDRINWRHTNSHRIDLVRLPEASRTFDEDQDEFNRRGYRNNGKVIPVDESYFNHWNRNPWHLETGGEGREMGDGAVFLLPYYMGLYHGFIR
jgi:hypothetical protein